MLLSRQHLCESICNHLSGRNPSDTNSTFSNLLPQSVAVNIHMTELGIEWCVLRVDQVHRPGVVALDRELSWVFEPDSPK